MKDQIFYRIILVFILHLLCIPFTRANVASSDTLFYNEWLERVPKEMAHFYTLYTIEGPTSKLFVYTVDGDRVYMKGFFTQTKPTPWNGNVKWFFYNGRIKHEGNFKDGKPVGKHSYYTDSGSLMAEENYTLGRLNGPIYEYYRNGRLRAKTLMKNGIQNGETVIFWKNGKEACIGIYRDGKKEGYWNYYDETGMLVKSVKYETIFNIEDNVWQIEFADNRWLPKGIQQKGDATYMHFDHTPVKVEEVGSTVPRLIIINEKVEYMSDIVYFSSNCRSNLPFAHEKDLSYKDGDFNIYPSMGYEGRFYRKKPYSSKALVMNSIFRDRGLTVILEVNEKLYSIDEREYRDVIRGVRYIPKKTPKEKPKAAENKKEIKESEQKPEKVKKKKRSKKKSKNEKEGTNGTHE